MRNFPVNRPAFIALLVSLLLAVSFPALADKPQSPGKGGNNYKYLKKEKSKQKENSSGRSQLYFNERQRNVIHNYYTQEYQSGNCPPGLAKKNNGCMPPGQAKKWRIGSPLPRDVVYYDLPTPIVNQLGRPPAGYRYIRVASDVLLMATGTGMIVDAIEDLNSM